jgi:hypothetical protein
MLSSPFEDFSNTTLQAVSGTLGKLVYLAGLRDSDGQYTHWGLARRHGSQTANTTIADAHANIFSQLLRTPLSSLWNEVSELASAQGSDAIRFMNEVRQGSRGLVPSDLRGGSRRHFNSVLLALSSLAAASPEAIAGPGA